MSVAVLRIVLAALLLAPLGCRKDTAVDAGPTEVDDAGARATSPAPAGDAGILVEDIEDPLFPGDKSVYTLPWRTEIDRTAFDLRLPMPSTAIQVSENEGPIRRFRERRSDMSFFVEQRGAAGMPQTLPDEDSAHWYAQAYAGYDIAGPRKTSFAGQDAAVIQFHSRQDEQVLNVAVFTFYRGGFLYGVGIESSKPKRVIAAAQRIAKNAYFKTKATPVPDGEPKTLRDLSVYLPGARELIEARALGGVSLIDRETRFQLLVSRAPLAEAPWAKSLQALQQATDAQRFPGFELRGGERAKVGLKKGFAIGYRTDGATKEQKVFIYQTIVSAFGYAYLFTASGDARQETEIVAFMKRSVRGARFMKPF